MKKQKKLIVANWKMNPQTVREAKKLSAAIRAASSGLSSVKTVICPPAVFLGELKKDVRGDRVVLGAQDVFYEGEGAHTGEISPCMLVGTGARYVILGHSERRARGEGDEVIARKVRAAIGAGLNVILCVGEQIRDEEGAYLAVVKRQLDAVFNAMSPEERAKVTIAYEPVWAVGEGATRADTPEDIFEMTIYIRKVLAETGEREAALRVQVLYGGSVDAHNAAAFLAAGGVSGLLVGRASVDAKQFKKILEAADDAHN